MYSLLLLLLSLNGNYEGPYEQKAFEIYFQDSIQIDVLLRYTSDQQPQEYVAHVTTPVCKEGLCHILVVDLYWDLLGNFDRYDLPPGRPLTKFDHEEFSEADYAKLDKILADQYSLLGEHAIEDLVDKSTERVSQEVDAVTGATMKAVENTVVSGAVYSTYALWHLVNGQIAQRIPEHTQGLWNETMLMQFLTSEHYPYHYYALDQLPDTEFNEYLPEIARLIQQENVFVARYAIQKFPASVCRDSTAQQLLTQQFAQTDFTTQNLIIRKLQSVPVYSMSLDVLTKYLDQLSVDQLKAVLSLLLKNSSNLSESSLASIINLLNHADPTYSQLAFQSLKPLSQQHPQLQNTLHNYETAHAKP